MSISNFIRFEDEAGVVLYGEVQLPGSVSKFEGTSVKVLAGDPFTGFTSTGKETKVKKVRNFEKFGRINNC
jgi:hypothetical protein